MGIHLHTQEYTWLLPRHSSKPELWFSLGEPKSHSKGEETELHDDASKEVDDTRGPRRRQPMLRCMASH